MSSVEPTTDRPSRLAHLIDWWFRDRTSGAIVIGQLPNAAIGAWLAATVVRLLDLLPERERELGWIGSGALVVWGVDELARGANPFRRLLGAAVLGWQVVQLVR